MPPLRIAIVEDEMIIAADIQDMLQELGYEVFEPAVSFEEGLLLARQERPDIFLLDINLNEEKTGIDLAISLQSKGIPFIFITSHADKRYIELAKQTRPFGYLIKPFTKHDLFASIEMAVGHIALRPINNLFLPIGKNKQSIPIRDIFYVKANGNYVELKIGSKRIALRKNLKEFESKLPSGHPFLRIHKSFLVNGMQVVSYTQTELILKDGSKIPIGRTYFSEIKNNLNIL